MQYCWFKDSFKFSSNWFWVLQKIPNHSNQMSLLRKSLRISSNISFDLGRRNQIKSNQILLMRKFTSIFFKYFFDVWKQIKSKQIKFSSWENWVKSIQIYFPVKQKFSNQVKSDFVSQICCDKYKQINLNWFEQVLYHFK